MTSEDECYGTDLPHDWIEDFKDEEGLHWVCDRCGEEDVE